MSTLLKRIDAILTSPAHGVDAPHREHIEHTLTHGYACRMALEAERGRIEREIGEVTRRQNGERSRAAELFALTDRLSTADSDIAQLNELLQSLKQRVRMVRS